MVKEYFNQVSSTFEAVQGTFSSNVCPSKFRQICRHDSASPLLCPLNEAPFALALSVFRSHDLK